MLHPKRKSSRELTFTAPFSLRLCQQRLLGKAKHVTKSWFSPAIQIEVFPLNDETLDFYVKRGVTSARGRLDKAHDKSTLVNFTISINWIRQLPKVVFAIAILIGFGAAHLLNLWFVNTLPFDSNSDGATLEPNGFVAPTAAALEPFYDAAQVHVFIASGMVLLLALIFIGYRARRERKLLSQEIEAALADQITDIPDLSALETDGEIVYTSNYVYEVRTPSSRTDVDLSNLSTDKDHDRKT